MEAISLVEHLRDLTANPQNRATIVKDKGCLAGLVLFLDNSDGHVVNTALQALKNLAKHKPNRTVMKNELGMLESLRAIMHRNGDAKIKQAASEVYIALNQSQEQTLKQNNTNSNQRPVLGAATRRSKMYSIQVKGLSNQITKRICEEQLLTVKGMISFTFDMARGRCIVRARPDISAEVVCAAINKTKVLSAQQIVKNERGEEVTVSFNSAHNKSQNRSCSAMQDTSATLPDYLPEDDEHIVSKSAVAKVKNNDDKENQGWFGSVSSFFSKTLYW